MVKIHGAKTRGFGWLNSRSCKIPRVDGGSCMKLMKFPDSMRLGFDPFKDETLRQVFQDDTARTLYLLWRSYHITGDDFPHEVLPVAAVIRECKPTTTEDL